MAKALQPLPAFVHPNVSKNIDNQGQVTPQQTTTGAQTTGETQTGQQTVPDASFNPLLWSAVAVCLIALAFFVILRKINKSDGDN